MMRPVLLVLGFLGVVGVAAAAPLDKQGGTSSSPVLPKHKKPGKPTDPWAKQYTAGPPPQVKPPVYDPPPGFDKLQRMSLEMKASRLGVKPEAVVGPIRLSTRAPYHDAEHYLQFNAAYGELYTSPQHDSTRIMFGGAWPPSVTVNLKATANRRYLVECAVLLTGAYVGPLQATDGTVTYTVSGEATTLVFIVDPQASDRAVQIHLSSQTSWYFNGCEISS